MGGKRTLRTVTAFTEPVLSLGINCTGTLSQSRSLTLPNNSVRSRSPDAYRPVMGLHTRNVLPYRHLSLTALPQEKQLT